MKLNKLVAIIVHHRKMFRFKKRNRGEKKPADAVSPTANSLVQPTSDGSAAIRTTQGTTSSAIASPVKGSGRGRDEGLVIENAELTSSAAAAISPKADKVEEEPAHQGVILFKLDTSQRSISTQVDVSFAASGATHDPSAPIYTREEWAAALWDEAYDRLKDDESTTLCMYESYVSRYIAQNGRFGLSLSPPHQHSSHNAIVLDDRSTRRARMNHLIDIWLGQAKKEDDSNHKMRVDASTYGKCSLKENLRTTVSAYPHTSLIWATWCLAIEVRPNMSPA